KAFERVFGSKQNEPEVARVLELKKGLEERIAVEEKAARSISGAPFGQSGPAYLALGKLLLEVRREKALDCLFLAAELEPQEAESLRIAARALTRPRETFLRLNTLRRLLERAPGDADASETLRKLYSSLGLNPDQKRPPLPGGEIRKE